MFTLDSNWNIGGEKRQGAPPINGVYIYYIKNDGHREIGPKTIAVSVHLALIACDNTAARTIKTRARDICLVVMLTRIAHGTPIART